MNKRIAKKRAERWTARVWDLPYVLSHAKPSFWTLRDIGQQRCYVAHRLAKLTVKSSLRRYVAKHWTPSNP